MDDMIIECPACEGQGALLGALGNLVWFRCIQCGIDMNVARENLPADLPAISLLRQEGAVRKP